MNQYSPLRTATEQDIPRLVEIEGLTQIAPWSIDVFQQCFLQRHHCVVVEENALMIGFIMISSALTGENHILNLCVDPDYQRKGYGKMLLDYAISQAKLNNVDIIYLEVRRSNNTAIRLYDKSGFVQIGERKNYYPSPGGREDALIMAMDLTAFRIND